MNKKLICTISFLGLPHRACIDTISDWNQLSTARCGSHCLPGVWISDEAKWQYCTHCLAIMSVEMGHEDALFWPGALPRLYPAWPMTSSLKRPRQTACSHRGTQQRLLAAQQTILPQEHDTLSCACDSWQMEVKTGPNCSTYEMMWRLTIQQGTGSMTGLSTLHFESA